MKKKWINIMVLALAIYTSSIATGAENAKDNSANSSSKPKIEIIVLPKLSYSFAGMTYPGSLQWVGLFLNGNSSILQKVTVSSVPVKVDSCYEGKVPAQKLTISGRSLPICLLRGLKNKNTGPITTYYPPGRSHTSATGPRSGFAIKIEGGAKNHLQLKATEKDKFISYVLKQGGKEQLLKKQEIDPIVGIDGMPRRDQLILWAGDLDSDGKADFITAFNTRTGEGISVQLFLSTKAKADEIVGLASEFDYWPPDNPGC